MREWSEPNYKCAREGRTVVAMITSEHAYQVRPRKDHRSVVTAETQPQPRFLRLSAIISQYFIDGMMRELANPVQQRVTVIEIRPFKGGWQC